MHRLKINITFFFLLFALIQIRSQTVNLVGYAFEEDNRGFLNEVKITVLKMPEKIIAVEAVSDLSGEFKVQIPAGMKYLVRAEKDIFQTLEMNLDTEGKSPGEKVFLKMEMKRRPGYLFDATLAEKRKDPNQVVDAVQGALIEIYNNTTGKSEKILTDHPNPYFSHTFEQGNHYTIMIRKEGFLAKRIEAYINVKGCIVCVDGVKKLGPGITDNLTAGFEMGTLLANIEMDRADLNSKIAIDNIYYDLNKWAIRPEAAKELDKVVVLMKDNPEINVELGSHTDSRGGDQFNLELSQKRAKAAVEYIIEHGGVAQNRINFKGYGETQLVNGCKNGVKCSERRHQLNRRTELKIIGFNETKNYISLEEMIRREKFERDLKNIGNESAVRITEDGKAVRDSKIPTQVKKVIINSGTETEIEKPRPKQTEQHKKIDPIFDMAIDSVRKHAGASQKHKIPTQKIENVLIQPVQESISEPAENSENSISVDENYSQISAPVRREDIVVAEARKDLEKLRNSESTNLNNSETTTKLAEKARGMKGELIINNDSQSQNEINPEKVDFDRSIASNYTGYKIEVIVSKTMLPENHEIFSEYGGVYIERLANGEYSYLVGDFKVQRIALYYLNNTVYDKYDKAKLVLFTDGERR